jgi:hypothetical protein
MATTSTTPDDGQVRPDDGSIPTRRGNIGRIVAGSLATGVVAALLLVAAPFIQEQANDITGAVLWGFALGWAMLAVLSMRFTDQPQRFLFITKSLEVHRESCAIGPPHGRSHLLLLVLRND